MENCRINFPQINPYHYKNKQFFYLQTKNKNYIDFKAYQNINSNKK